MKELDRLGAASSAAAVNDQFAITVEFAYSPGQVVERDQMPPDIADLVFVGLSNVEHEDIFFIVELLLEFLDVDQGNVVGQTFLLTEKMHLEASALQNELEFPWSSGSLKFCPVLVADAFGDDGFGYELLFGIRPSEAIGVHFTSDSVDDADDGVFATFPMGFGEIACGPVRGMVGM